VDTFKLEAVSLGKELPKIRIGHNGKRPGDGWFLDKVVVRDESNRLEETFECKRWLATDEDDGLIVRELFAASSRKLQQLATTSYHVKVKTGDKRGAGTDARVTLKLFGDKADSGDRHLNKADNGSGPFANKFERNQLDEFVIESDDLGNVS
jgi:hypothetical protein